MNTRFQLIGCAAACLILAQGAALSQTDDLWQPRSGHQMAAFNNLLVVVGGFDAYDASVFFNDVWTSDDGAAWAKNAAPPPVFLPRQLHGTVVFKNYLWVLGGQSDAYYNDVWRSSSGAAWEEITSAADWSPRRGMACVVHNNKLFVIGGETQDGELLSEVWTSDDGRIWELAATAPWQPRWQHAVASFQGKLWMIGGSSNYKVHDNAWQSEDGVEWTQSAEPTPFALKGHRIDVFNNALCVTGGCTDQDKASNKVWTSLNGQAWTEATEPAPWEPRYRHATAVYDKRLWVAGGLAQTDDAAAPERNDVWYTDDGKTWKQASDGPISCARCSGGCSGNDVKHWRRFLGDWFLLGLSAIILLLSPRFKR